MERVYQNIFNAIDQEISVLINRQLAWQWEEQCRTQAAHLANALDQAFKGDESADVVERAVVATRMLVIALLKVPRTYMKHPDEETP
jgi:hypothetical protein